MGFLTWLWSGIWKWVAAAGALLAAVASVYLAGRGKGKAVEKVNTQAAQEAAATAQATVKAQGVRNDVELETAKLPDAPIQKVADADAATAAGHLRDDGWVRPEGPGQD